MHPGAERNRADRQGVARLDVGLFAGDDLVADINADRRQDVALLSVA